jgi:hypothetical protein
MGPPRATFYRWPDIGKGKWGRVELFHQRPVAPAVDRPKALMFPLARKSMAGGNSWRDGVYDYVHYHSRIHEVLGIARGTGKVQLGGPLQSVARLSPIFVRTVSFERDRRQLIRQPPR